MIYLGHYIAGKPVKASGSRFHPITNPATGEVIRYAALADASEVDAAVAAANAAFPAWSKTPVTRRVKFLYDYKQLLMASLDELAKLISEEHGKTIADAKGSIQRGIEALDVACGTPELMKGWYSETVGTSVDAYAIRQPLGVCVGITPFNFPAMIPLWMFPLAIASGNTFVLKPSEQDPSVTLHLAELLSRTGIPPGVFNVLLGDKTTSELLIKHEDVKAVSFVGSSQAAHAVSQMATQHGKRVQAFGGAKNHGVVMQDADLKQVADAIVGAAYGSAGERCMALSAIVAVGDEVADQLVPLLKERIVKLRIGSGQDDATEMGPLISAPHRQKVMQYLDIGVQEGATLVIDGRLNKIHQTMPGFYLAPSLFDHVKQTMRIYQEEIFGPVLSILRVKTLKDAITLVNEHPYGNGSAIFTRDGAIARAFVTYVQCGMVGVNIPIPVPVAFHAFGGWKRSVFADTQMHGVEGIAFYTKMKKVTARWSLNEPLPADLMMKTHCQT